MLPGFASLSAGILRASASGLGSTLRAAWRPDPPRQRISSTSRLSLEDGKRYKSLKRRLNGRGLSPEQYREKWGLPRDYPMVAPNYAKQRSDLAKALGLGQLRRNRAAGSDLKAQVESTPEPAKKARGRRKRTAEAA